MARKFEYLWNKLRLKVKENRSCSHQKTYITYKLHFIRLLEKSKATVSNAERDLLQ